MMRMVYVILVTQMMIMMVAQMMKIHSLLFLVKILIVMAMEMIATQIMMEMEL